MPNEPADSSNEFEWPPREDVLASQVFKLGDPLPAAVSVPAAPEPARALPEEPHLMLRRTLEARAEAQAGPEGQPQRNTPPSAWTPPPVRGGNMRSRLVPFALVALAAVVVLQTVYILRGRREASAPATNRAPAVKPPVANGNEQESPDRPAFAEAPAGKPAPPVRRTPAPAAKPNPAPTSGTRASGTPAGARLVIRSDPPGARVSIDGRPRGETPLTLTGVRAGEYRLTLERDGVQVQQTVRVADPNGTFSVLAPMRPSGPLSGWLALQSPIVLDVFEGGSLVGTSRSSRILLPAGQHSLQLVNEQLDFREARDVQVEPGDVLQLAIELPQANVLVNATPWAEVYIDGNHVGQTPIGRLSLPIGTYDVVFRHPELGEKTVIAVVKAGTPTRVTMDMRR